MVIYKKGEIREREVYHQSKVNRHTNSPIGVFPRIDAYFPHVHIDFVGLLPLSDCFDYIFTCINRLTRFPIVISITDITSETEDKALTWNYSNILGKPIH